ncbi:MAG: GGDEF domain-containing protein [Novosphingobium sp.]
MSAPLERSPMPNIRDVDFAYQPIIGTSSLRVHGFEALARIDTSEFSHIHDFLNHSYSIGKLREAETGLLRSAISKFCEFPEKHFVRLFCNVDNRTYDGLPLHKASVVELLEGTGLPAANLCLEISERHPMQSFDTIRQIVEMLMAHGAHVALDDFGIGNSGLHMLLNLEPHYVKIDRTFIAGIASSTRKQAIVAKLCGLAHALGFQTVAEGVENESDFRMSRDIGCDLAQGFHIAKPTTNIRELSVVYGQTLTVSSTPRMSPRVAELLTPVEPVYLDQPLRDVADTFKERPDLRLLPVIDRNRNVQGAVLEEDVRRLMLSDFGRSLLANKGMDTRIGKLLRRCPVADANGTVEAIVNSYVTADGAQGLILISDGRYAGYLNNNAVLRLAAEREVNVAREQNPLTRLAGTESIQRHWDNLLVLKGPRMVAFLDFDNFKAFNDSYGFASGDRALLMFAGLLRRLEKSRGAFVAHIGGDDFLLSMGLPESEGEQAVRDLQLRFAQDVESLYTADDRGKGGITAIDRFGVARFFPLLQISAGVVHLSQNRAGMTREDIVEQLNAAKAAAKRAENGLAVRRLPERKRARASSIQTRNAA